MIFISYQHLVCKQLVLVKVREFFIICLNARSMVLLLMLVLGVICFRIYWAVFHPCSLVHIVNHCHYFMKLWRQSTIELPSCSYLEHNHNKVNNSSLFSISLFPTWHIIASINTLLQGNKFYLTSENRKLLIHQIRCWIWNSL